jgi:hypothetical protein
MKHFNFLQSEIVLSCLGALSRLSHQVINIIQVSHFVFFFYATTQQAVTSVARNR